MAREIPLRRRRFVRLGLVAGACVCAATAMAFAEPTSSVSHPASPQAEKATKSGAVVPGPGSISLVVLAGGCLLYGRKRPTEPVK